MKKWARAREGLKAQPLGQITGKPEQAAPAKEQGVCADCGAAFEKRRTSSTRCANCAELRTIYRTHAEREKHMSGFNLKGMQAAMNDGRIEKFNKSYGRSGGSDFKFKTAYWSSLTDGTYDLRLLPKHPTKCPHGYVRVSTHKIEVKVGEKPVEVFCSYKPGVEDSSCYLCDLLEAVADEVNSFSKEIQEIFNDMNARQIFIFPGIMTMRPDPDFRPSDGKKYAPWVPSEKSRQGVMLQLEGKRVVTALFDLLKEYPDANDPDEGYWLRVIKQGKEAPVIRAHRKPSELTAEEAALMADKDYPSLYPAPKFMKSTRDLTYAQQEALVKDAWWAKDVISDEEDATLGDDDLPWEP